MRKEVDFSELEGKTILKIKGLEKGSDEVEFITDNGSYIMKHSQDCCEVVDIEDIHGNPDNCINQKVQNAVVVTNQNNPKDPSDSFTWTYYYISTEKDSFTIRWYGSSNGYYSEEVDFILVEE